MNRLATSIVSSAFALAFSTIESVAVAAPPGWQDYTVKAGDTCASIALHAYGDSTRYDLVHEGNPELGPLPHVLKAGMTLHLPPKPTVSPDAKLTGVRNVVQVNANRAHPNDPLFRGNRVETESAAAADIEFRDTTDLELGENTLVIIFGDSAKKSTQSRTSADATLLNGRLRAHLGELAGAAPVSIHTDSGVATLGKGEVQVHVDEKKATRLAVYQGRADLIAQRRTVQVNQGFGSKALVGKAPTPPRPLPAAPAWGTGLPELVLTQGNTPVDVWGTYAQGTGGAGPGDPLAEWHVQLARDDRFRDIVVDTRVPVAVIRLDSKQMPPGAYFARVSAIDVDKFEGPFGTVAHVEVASVDVQALPHHESQVDVTPRGLACALDDAPLAPLTAPLHVDRHEPHRLRCRTASNPAAQVATFELPADALGPLNVQAEWARKDLEHREGDILVEVLDGDRAPIPRPVAAITSLAPDVTVRSVEPSGALGAYLAHVEWTPVATACTLQIKLANADPATVSLPTPQEAPVLQLVPHWEVSLGGGVVVTNPNGVGYAPRAELGVNWKTDLGPGLLRIGVGASVESDPTLAGAQTSPPPAFVSGGSLDIAYRWGRAHPRFAPYVLVAPQILGQTGSQLSATGTESRATLLGVAGMLGAEVKAGGGGFYLEGGYRLAARLAGPDTIATQGGVFTLGYRLEL